LCGVCVQQTRAWTATYIARINLVREGGRKSETFSFKWLVVAISLTRRKHKRRRIRARHQSPSRCSKRSPRNHLPCCETSTFPDNPNSSPRDAIHSASPASRIRSLEAIIYHIVSASSCPRALPPSLPLAHLRSSEGI